MSAASHALMFPANPELDLASPTRTEEKLQEFAGRLAELRVRVANLHTGAGHVSDELLALEAEFGHLVEGMEA